MEWQALTPYHRAGWMDGGCGSMRLGTGSCSSIEKMANGSWMSYKIYHMHSMETKMV